MRDNSFDSVASQGNSVQLRDNRFERQPKKQCDFLDIDKVEKNRIRIERIKNVLETQYERDISSLERSLQTQVQSGSFQSRQIRNASLGLGTNTSIKGRNSFNNRAKLIGHRHGQILERLKGADVDQQKQQL